MDSNLIQKCLALKERFDAVRSGKDYFDAMVIVRSKWEEMQKHPALSGGILGVDIVITENDVEATMRFMYFRGKKVLVVTTEKSFIVDTRKLDEMYGKLNNSMG